MIAIFLTVLRCLKLILRNWTSQFHGTGIVRDRYCLLIDDNDMHRRIMQPTYMAHMYETSYSLKSSAVLMHIGEVL